jgi:hypothetical protein
MKGGEVRPEPALISEVTKEREAVVWPEEAPGDDRITGKQSSSQLTLCGLA